MIGKCKVIALWLGALLVVAFALLFFEADMLWKVQQQNTFLYSSLYFKQMMISPGGMLLWLGGFFTQHFFYPWLGVVLICGWWLLLMWLTKRTFLIPDKWNVLTLIPVAILIIANMDLGYWVYMIKLRGYFFAPTIGVTVGTALLWVFRLLPDKLWMRIAYVVGAALVCYPLMGTYALVAVVLMGLWTWRLSANHIHNSVLTVVALLSVVAVPLLYYRFVYYETNLTNIYRTAIPFFSVTDDYPNYYIPYYALAVCYLLLVGAYGIKPMKPVKQWIAQGCVLALVAGCVYHFWYKDANFHHELRMQRCVEEADWEDVVEEGTKQVGEPTRAIVLMNNLALSRLGRQCDEMYNFPKGSSKINTPLPVYMYHIAGRLIFYQYGLMNECHRICMEEGVEHGWSLELLKYMARCAIFSHEPQAARKFLDILRQTQYYGEWADRMEKLLNDPDQLASDRETGPITHMLHYNDRLDSVDGYVERFLMNILAQHDADDPYFQEQAVIASLWTRNPDYFWPRFEQYVNQNPDRAVPRIFQEAAYLFGKLDGLEWVEDLPFEQSVKDNFYAFMQLMQQYKTNPSKDLRQFIFEHYGTTYYFEYFFLRDITYY